MTETIRVDIALPPGALAELYRGRARDVLVRAHDGRIVRFRISALRGAVARRGVNGRALVVDGRRLVRIGQLAGSIDVAPRANR